MKLIENDKILATEITGAFNSLINEFCNDRTYADFGIFLKVVNSPGERLAIKIIREDIGVDGPKMSRIMQHLGEKGLGLLEYIQDKDNPRGLAAIPSKKGKKLVKKIEEQYQRICNSDRCFREEGGRLFFTK